MKPLPAPEPPAQAVRRRRSQRRRTQAVTGAIVAGALATSAGATVLLAWPGIDTSAASDWYGQLSGQSSSQGTGISARHAGSSHATSKGS
jgi:hypothetical protein